MAFAKRKYSGRPVGRWKKYKQTVTGKSRIRSRMGGSVRYSRTRALNYKIRKAVNNMAETKEVMLTLATNVLIPHNQVVNLYNNAFYSKLGSAGEQFQIAGSGSRVGKKAYIKGISVALHIENQQYRPEVKYCLMLIRNKAAKDVPLTTKSQIFEDINTTIPLDYIDTGKVDVMFCKYFNVKQSNVGTTLTAGPAGVFDHGEVEGILPDLYEGINTVSTNPRWMGKFYVPINKDVMYNDFAGGSSEIPATYRYQWVIYGYDNRTSTTGSTTWPIGHVNMTTKLKFKDL